MKKLFILLTLVLTTTACSVESKPVVSENAKHICIDGFTYIVLSESPGSQGFGHMSGKLDKDNNAIPCDNSVEIVQ